MDNVKIILIKVGSRAEVKLFNELTGAGTSNQVDHLFLFIPIRLYWTYKSKDVEKNFNWNG